MSTLHCVRGCTRANTDGHIEPVPARRGQLCNACYNRLETWLREIPERYALLPEYLHPTADLDRNPEATTTKRTSPPVPIRLAALDLMDHRRGRKWQGTEPATDRRGALGTLLAIANEIRDGRNIGARTGENAHVLGEADMIRANLDWLTEHDMVADAYREIHTLHRQLGDAIGEYPPRPVGTCKVIPDGETEPCGGPLLPNHAGVICPRCHSTWDHDRLRLLGLTLGDTG
jgi:hypothetical protein